MDKHEAYKILGVNENATPKEIKKARDRLALKYHTDKGGSNDEIARINAAYDVLTKDNSDNDSSDIDEDAIFLMEQKIKNAFDYNNVKMEEMEDETVKGYKVKLKACKTKADLEKFTSEVVFFIQIYARARDAGYFDKSNKKPPKPSNPTNIGREGTGSDTSAPKYKEFTCDWCTLKVGADDPRPKYTFTGSDKAFCCAECRENWDKNDRWYKDWDERKKKEAQEWEDYKKKQDQKWTDYFAKANTSSYSSYSTYTSPVPSSSGSSISDWLSEYQQRRDKQKSEDLTENKKRYIRDVKFELSLKSVSDSQLNTKLGVSDWRERINQATDDMEAWSRKFEMENLVEKLAREYTCARCGALKDNYLPWEKEGKKYCSLECKDGKDKKENEELKKEIWKIKRELKGLGNSVEELSRLLLDWIKLEGIVEVSLKKGGGLVIKLKNGSTKNLEEKKLTLSQLGLKKYLESSGKNSLNQNEIEKLAQGLYNEEKEKKRKDKMALIGGTAIVVLVVAVIIGIVVWIRKKD